MSELIDYQNWISRQDIFTAEADELRKSKMPHWGSYSYHVSIMGQDYEGKHRLARFNVRQFFCESFSKVEDLDFTYYPRPKANYAKISEFLAAKRHYTSCVYDKIASFVLSLPESPLVVFEHSNIANWGDIDGFHFDYLRELFIENGIAFVDVDSFKKYAKNVAMPIVVVELISNNDRMLYKCESILKFGVRCPTLIYISLLKEYDREEMFYLIKENEKLSSVSISPTSTQEISQYPSDYEKLLANSMLPKTDYEDFKKLLQDNGISYLYHFTDRRNLDSIRKNGGLYSWYYCQNNNIDIPYPGGDSNSKYLDQSFGLQDYVRLSFCEDHPMSWRLQQEGYDLVLLKVKIDAAWINNTIFSDINAADKMHHHGGTLEDLKKVDFNSTKLHYVRKDSPFFKSHQAEVLVRTFLPLEYIINIDNPDTI